jgi:endonuclease/exonuclease/phosphatase family metal-dependent hydrolase
MPGADPAQPRLTRRAVVGSVAGLAAGTAVSGTASAATPASVTVLNQNAYLGVDLTRLLAASSLKDVRRIAGELLARVDPAIYEARAGAFADAVAAHEPDVVALQEVAVLRTQLPGDFGSDSAEPATHVVVDFLATIESALADRALDYEVVAETVTTDVELPASGEDGPVDVRITDRDVLLARSELDTEPAASGTYEAALRYPLPEGGEIAVRRGYSAAEVSVDGVGFTAVSTHLESIRGSVRHRQGRELLELLPTDRPVFLCGDFNSGPGGETATYDELTASFEDPYAALRPEADGFTCCQAADLRNEHSRLDRRVDGILVRGAANPTAIRRIGHRPEDRVTATLEGEVVSVWPADHAGIVGTFEVAGARPTTTPTAERTAATTAAPITEASGGSGPGFGVLGAIGAVAVGVLSRLEWTAGPDAEN